MVIIFKFKWIASSKFFLITNKYQVKPFKPLDNNGPAVQITPQKLNVKIRPSELIK